MILFLIIVTIIIMGFCLLQRLKFDILINLSERDTSATILCLQPLLQMRIIVDDNRPVLIIKLLNLTVYQKTLKLGKVSHKKSIIKYLDFEDLKVNTYYGLGNPFATGIFSGAMGFAQMIPFPAQIRQYPDFFTVSEYFRIDASGYLKLGTTIKNYISKRKTIKGE